MEKSRSNEHADSVGSQCMSRVLTVVLFRLAICILLQFAFSGSQGLSCAQDGSGALVVETPNTEFLAEEKRSLFDVEIDGKAGFIDKFGKIVIQPVYDKAYPFSEGLAAVHVEEKWGYIDSSGNFAIAPQFITATPFSEGRARVQIVNYSDPFGYIDMQGKIVIKPQYDCAESFRAGIAKVGKATWYSQLNARIADVGVECVDSYIDIHGNPVSAPKPGYYASQPTGTLFPYSEGDQFGYVDAKGSVVIAAQFLHAEEFSEGLAVVCDGEMRYGYIHENGEFAIPPRFARGNAFAGGLAGVQFENGLWGFINRDGETVIPGKYSWVYGGFRDGLSKVAYENRSRYIDRDGNWVW